MKDGHLIYPGDEWCNPQQPHSKWHLQSGIGLLDLVYLCDNMYQLTSSQSHSLKHEHVFNLDLESGI